MHVGLSHRDSRIIQLGYAAAVVRQPYTFITTPEN